MRACFTAGLVASVLVLALGGAGAPHIAVEPATPPPSGSALRESHPLHGGFWRPAGSDAVRPALRLTPVAWVPDDVQAAPSPGTLAAVAAVARLALD